MKNIIDVLYIIFISSLLIFGYYKRIKGLVRVIKNKEDIRPELLLFSITVLLSIFLIIRIY